MGNMLAATPLMEIRSLEALAQALNSAQIRYLVVGGLAVNAHGFVRMTRDVDLVLRLTPENAERGLAVLLAAGWQLAVPVNPSSFADAATRQQWRREKNMIVLKLWSDQHPRTPVDLFIYEPFDFEKEYGQAVPMEIAPGVFLPVIGLEGLIRMKRESGRPQDLIDIEELGRAQ